MNQTDQISFEFTEQMRGALFFLSQPLKALPAKEDFSLFIKEKNESFSFKVKINIPQLDNFLNDPQMKAELTGVINSPFFVEQLEIKEGTFNLFSRNLVDQDFLASKEMHYHFVFLNKNQKPYTFFGFKVLEKENMTHMWNETTTLYSLLFEGKVKDPIAHPEKVIALGVLKLNLDDLLKQIGTFKTNAPNFMSNIVAISKFLNHFAGHLWESYAPFIFSTESFHWNEHIFPLYTLDGVHCRKKESFQFHTDDGLSLHLHRFSNRAKKDVILLVHGLTTSTDMFVMPEHYNLTQYLLNNGFTDIWSLDWRGSMRYTYNLTPHRYSVDHVAKYDLPAAIKKMQSILPIDSRIHIIAHCVGSISVMCSLSAGWTQGVTSVISNSVSLHPKIKWQALLKLIFGPGLMEYLFGYAYISPKIPYFPGPGFGKWIYWMERLLRRECREPACHMVSFMWGWGFPAAYRHENLSPLTHRRLMDLFGGTSFHYFRHIRKMVFSGEAVIYNKVKEFFSASKSYYQCLKGHKKWFPTLLISGNKNDIFPHSNKKTYSKIKKELPHEINNLFEYLEIDNYGHQDIFIGKKAHKDVFPHILKFLKKQSSTIEEEK